MLTNDVQTNLKMLRHAVNAVYTESQIMADLCFTQGVHESNLLGVPSQLAAHYNNLFGIKGKGLTGKSIMLPTWEVIDGKTVYVKAAFAYNDSLEDSVRQHYNLMQKDRYKPVRESKTLDEAFVNIVKSGYATDLSYTDRLRAVWNKIKDTPTT